MLTWYIPRVAVVYFKGCRGIFQELPWYFPPCENKVNSFSVQLKIESGLQVGEEFYKKPECVSFIHSFIPLKFSSTVTYNSVRHTSAGRNASVPNANMMGSQTFTKIEKIRIMFPFKFWVKTNGLD